jgi:sec-independent protein translocase protein TatB
MFDIGALELLVFVIVAVLVIGPKDMPAAMRTAGRWIGKIRKVSAHFRTGVDAMVREAELEDMEKKWKARNEEIMRQNPQVVAPAATSAESAIADHSSAISGEDQMTGPPPADGPPDEAGTPADGGHDRQTNPPADKTGADKTGANKADGA